MGMRFKRSCWSLRTGLMLFGASRNKCVRMLIRRYRETRQRNKETRRKSCMSSKYKQ